MSQNKKIILGIFLVFFMLAFGLWGIFFYFQNIRKASPPAQKPAVQANVASAAGLSDAEAKKIAQEMAKTIEEIRKPLSKAATQKDSDACRKLVKPVQTKLNAWPEEHLKNRAIFPYFGCKQYASSVIQYADVCARNNQDATWRKHVMKNLRSDQKECQRNLKKPDMSLKDIQ